MVKSFAFSICSSMFSFYVLWGIKYGFIWFKSHCTSQLVWNCSCNIRRNSINGVQEKRLSKKFVIIEEIVETITIPEFLSREAKTFVSGICNNKTLRCHCFFFYSPIWFHWVCSCGTDIVTKHNLSNSLGCWNSDWGNIEKSAVKLGSTHGSVVPALADNLRYPEEQPAVLMFGQSQPSTLSSWVTSRVPITKRGESLPDHKKAGRQTKTSAKGESSHYDDVTARRNISLR